MSDQPKQPPKELTFSEHFSEQFLHKIDTERFPSPLSEILPERAFLMGDEVLLSRFLFWGVFSGLFVPASDGNVNLEKHFMLRADYADKCAKHQTELTRIEDNDFENPLSRDYKLCFEIENKNQIKIDIVRICFLRELVHKHQGLLFRLLYTWSLENPQIGYRQGLIRRNERAGSFFVLGGAPGLPEELGRPGHSDDPPHQPH
jgi:hypothetical protein